MYIPPFLTHTKIYGQVGPESSHLLNRHSPLRWRFRNKTHDLCGKMTWLQGPAVEFHRLSGAGRGAREPQRVGARVRQGTRGMRSSEQRGSIDAVEETGMPSDSHHPPLPSPNRFSASLLRIHPESWGDRTDTRIKEKSPVSATKVTCITW